MYDLFVSLVILNYPGRTTQESKPWRRITRHTIRTLKNKFLETQTILLDLVVVHGDRIEVENQGLS